MDEEYNGPTTYDDDIPGLSIDLANDLRRIHKAIEERLDKLDARLASVESALSVLRDRIGKLESTDPMSIVRNIIST
jgi:hypothetical protein